MFADAHPSREHASESICVFNVGGRMIPPLDGTFQVPLFHGFFFSVVFVEVVLSRSTASTGSGTRVPGIREPVTICIRTRVCTIWMM